ncbi:MAG: hypothetical protein U0640_07940 [Phycisphaerales bacterium]
MALLPPILSTLLSLAASGLLTVLLLASAPNSKPQEWASIKAWLIAIGVVGFLGLIGAIWLMVVRKPMTAAAVGGVPAIFCIIALVIIIKTQQ